MATYVKDECPVCGYSKYSIFGTVKESDPPVPIVDGSVIVKCKNCHLVYVNPMPHWDSEDFSILYSGEYFSDFNSDEQKEWFDIRRNINPKKRFANICQYLKSTKNKMLEIGGGEYGFMGQYLMGKGWDVTIQEPSEAFFDKLHGLGLKVETRSILELETEDQFSLIYADSVLEHVPNPILYYEKLTNLLVPGGILYTISPNEYSMYNFLMGFMAKVNHKSPPYISPYRAPYHLTGFTKKSLKILAQKSGLELCCYKKMDDYMAFHAVRSKRHAFVRYPSALLFAISQILGLGTNGEAVFVKK